MNTKLKIKLGKGKRHSQSITLSEDCMEKLNKLLKQQNRKVVLSHIIETACWLLIDKEGTE